MIWRRGRCCEPHHVARWAIAVDEDLYIGFWLADRFGRPESVPPDQIVRGGRGKIEPKPKQFKVEWPK